MLNRYSSGLALILIIQAGLFYSASRGENTPAPAPLSAFPFSFGGWNLAQEGVVEKETLDAEARAFFLRR